VESRGFLDVGANVGFFTVMAKWFKGPAFPTVSVEVNPTNCALLLKTIEANGFWNSVVLPVAASDTTGLVYGNSSWNTGLVKGKGTDHFNVKYLTMPLDDLAMGPIDTVKIDVEGFELAALDGMRRTITSSKPTIFFEYNTHCMGIVGVDPLELLDFFFELGYSLTVLDYHQGMRATFTDAVACRDHIAKFGPLCDIMAKPI
jgi:FkbM family methyltransferase